METCASAMKRALADCQPGTSRTPKETRNPARRSRETRRSRASASTRLACESTSTWERVYIFLWFGGCGPGEFVGDMEVVCG